MKDFKALQRKLWKRPPIFSPHCPSMGNVNRQAVRLWIVWPQRTQRTQSLSRRNRADFGKLLRRPAMRAIGQDAAALVQAPCACIPAVWLRHCAPDWKAASGGLESSWEPRHNNQQISNVRRGSAYGECFCSRWRNAFVDSASFAAETMALILVDNEDCRSTKNLAEPILKGLSFFND